MTTKSTYSKEGSTRLQDFLQELHTTTRFIAAEQLTLDTAKSVKTEHKWLFSKV